MRFKNIKSYDILIFDCDGVIFDSNDLKINAMAKVLNELFDDSNAVTVALDYFKRNFGKSRFHHVDFFLSDVFQVENIETVRESILSSYSQICKELYVNACLSENIVSLFESLPKSTKLYVASGSEQAELIEVFCNRGLSSYFVEVLGSPIAKSENVSYVLNKEGSNNALMIGDAISDYQAAQDNNIDFICYLTFSKVRDKMLELSLKNEFRVVEDFKELINE